MKKTLIATLVILTVALFSAPVFAQFEKPDPNAPDAVAPAGESNLSGQSAGALKRKKDDASVDRNILFPTAETINKGDVTFNSYEVLFAGLTYGISDDMQISATTMLPIVTEIPFILLGSLKYRVLKNNNIIVSVQPNFSLFRETFNGSSGDETVTAGGFGASLLLDYLLDPAGKFVLTGGVNAQFMFGGSDESDFQVADGAIFYLYGAFSAKLGKMVKLMAELSLPGGIYWGGDGTEFEVVQQALLFNYGIRFFGKSVAVDLSFLRPIHPDVDTGSLLMGIPWLNFSARF